MRERERAAGHTMEEFVIKTTTTAVFAFCIGVATTVMWVKSEAKTRHGSPVATSQGISIEELHAKVALQDLPVMESKEPF
jgi:hypothetical protein